MLSILVIIMILVHFIPKDRALHQGGNMCISLCKGTVSRRIVQFCHCKTPYRGTLRKSVTKLRQWPSDARSCNNTGMVLRTCRVQYNSDEDYCDVQIGFDPNVNLQESCGQEFSCDWDTDEMSDSWNKTVFGDLVKAGCNTCVLNYFGPDLIDCSNCKLNSTKTLIEDTPSTSNWEHEYKTPISNVTITPLIYAARFGRIELFNFLATKGCNVLFVDENGDNILHLAAIGGSLGIAKQILSLGIVDKDSKGYLGRTSIMHAARHGHKEMFDFFVSQNSNLTTVDEEKSNILHMSCIGGNLDIVNTTVSRNGNIESRNAYKMTPLLMAARNGHIKVFDLLLKEGSNISTVNGKRENALHLASKRGQLEMVKHIFSLNFGHKESKAADDFTPLMFAAQQGNIDLFDFLVKQGSDTTAVDVDEESTILHIAIKAGQLEMVQHILSVDSSLKEMGNMMEETPLLYAAKTGHVDIFEFLLQKRCNKMATTDEFSNLLHLACESGNLDMVKRVYSMNLFDKECKEESGFTPLLCASLAGSLKVVQFLKDEGCEMTGTAELNNVLHLAARAGNIDLVKYIVSLNIVDKDDKNGDRVTPIMTAANKGHEEIFFYLMDMGCNVGGVDDSGNNILHLACIGGNVAIVDYLLSNKLVDKNSKGYERNTAVMRAVDDENVDIIRCLVKHGCDIKVVDDTGDNLLHLAIQNGDLSTVKFFMSLNVFDKEAKGNDGQTPLLQAVSNEEIEVFEYLLNQGCSVTSVDDDDNNILHLAGQNGNVDMTKRILAISGIEELKKMKNSDDYTPLELAEDYDYSDIVDLFKD